MDTEHMTDWHVTLHLSEYGKRTDVRAELKAGDRELRAHGEARRSPYDSNIPQIGDELAVARALIDLAQQLIRATEEDIATVEGHPVHLKR